VNDRDALLDCDESARSVELTSPDDDDAGRAVVIERRLEPAHDLGRLDRVGWPSRPRG
jgi:hypothetical protein